MKSFEEIYTEIQNATGEDGSAFLTKFKRWINDTDGIVLSSQSWPFMELTQTKTTVASKNNYQIPTKLRKILSVVISVDDTDYLPKPVEDPKYWEYLQSLNVSESDVAQRFYRQGNEILIWPTPATSAYTITIRGRKARRDLSLDDYTTGTIVSATTADETITGSGTSWATNAVGNFIRIDYVSGDFRWYEINSITDTTHLELVKPYAGTTFAAASETYKIGEFSDIPEDYHNLLVYRPLAIYYASMEDIATSKMYWMMYDGGKEAGYSNEVGGLLKKMEDDQLEKTEGVYLEHLEASEPSLGDLAIDNRDLEGESW